MEFRFLGPIGVQDERGEIALGGPKQRLVLALLLVRSGTVVSVDQLLYDVWGDEPPAAARSSLYAYISRLRKAIGRDRLLDGTGGYVLRVDAAEIDGRRFEAALTESRRLLMGDPGRAAIVLDDALALWRGAPFADLADEPALQAEIVRLRELRLSATDVRADALLALGREEEMIVGLERLLAEEPLRERTWAQLMVALYRAGRQGDALAAYLRARAMLADQLGIDPSAELERLQQRILRQDPELETPARRVRGYQLREPIGRGAFGTVYRALQPELGREVAIKVIHAGLADDPDFVRRFEREAQVVARLEHPHVVPLYDYWREPGNAYLTMRYLRGGNLAERIARHGRIPDDEVLRVVDEVASALGAAHRAGVIHRDVRPPNILFDEDGNAYLSDFGIARQVPVVAGAEPASSGAAYYLAPEEIVGGAVTPATDVYSLGLVLFELLAGRHPLADTPPGRLIDRHLRGRLPSLTRFRSDLPPPVARVVRRATATRASARYGDPLALAAALRAALTGGGSEGVSTRAPRNPYKGLRPFGEADAADFFGREALTGRLIARLSEPRAEARFLAVVGPSGSGKSSVVRAGLLPRLRGDALPGSARWFVVDMHPGSHPFEELAEALLRVAESRPPDLVRELAGDRGGLLRAAGELLPDRDAELLVVVDQFEELFTLTASEEERVAFLDALVTAARARHGRVRVVATLRADFFDRPLLYRVFGDLLARRVEAVPPLSAEELERAIVGPAEAAGLRLEPALVAQLLTDAAEATGSLPLLQYALSELFDRRKGSALTVGAYRDVGGVAGAVARRAEGIVRELDRAGEEAVRQLFLRLVTITDEGSADVRRRVLLTELEALDLDQGVVRRVLELFGRHRLLSFDRDPVSRGPTLEVAHEALLREWGRLRGWIQSASDDVRTHRRLVAALDEWRTAGEDASFLLRGSRLETFERWAADSGMSLTADERGYLDASVGLRSAEVAAEEARQAREAALERRSRFRLRALAGVMAGAAVVAVGLSLYAFDQARQAERERGAAVEQQAIADAQRELAESEQARAEQNARTAAARELAAAAQANLEVDPELAVLLALEAVRTTRDADGTVLPQAEQVLHSAVAASRIVESLPEAGGSVAWSPDGETLAVTGAQPTVELLAAASAEPTTVALYDASGSSIRAWEAHEAGVNGVSFSPDGELLATAGDDGTIRLWEAATGSPVRTLTGPEGLVWGLSFSPDGGRVAGLWLEPTETGPYRSSARVWDARTGDLLRTIGGLEAGDGLAAQRTAFDARGDRLAIATMATSSAVIYDLDTGEQVGVLSPADPARDPWGWSEVAWSPDGTLLAAAQAELVRIYDGVTLRYLYLLAEHSGWTTKLDWSADGSRLLTANTDGTVRLWRVDREAGFPILTLAGHASGVAGAALTADGLRAVTADAKGTVRIWDTGPTGDSELMNLPSEEVWLSSVIYDADGRAILGSVPGGHTAIWDAETGEELLMLGAHDPIPGFEGVPGVAAIAVSPDGRLVATGGRDAAVRLWSRTTGEQVHVLPVGDWVEDVQFSPDGRLLVVAGHDRAARIFDASSWRDLRSLDHDGAVLSAKFTSDGRRLVTGSWDSTVRVWNPATGEELRRIGTGWEVNDIGLHPDGAVVSVGGDGGAGLWSLESGERLMPLAGHSAEVWAVRFSPDGERVATAGLDGTIRVRDAATGVTFLELRSSPSHPWDDLAFSTDGSRLASIGRGAVHVWTLDIDELVELAGSNVTRSLTDGECRQYLHVEACP